MNIHEVAKAKVTIKEQLEAMSDEELDTALEEVQHLIDVTDCFGISDLIWEGLLIREIERRESKEEENEKDISKCD